MHKLHVIMYICDVSPCTCTPPPPQTQTHIHTHSLHTAHRIIYILKLIRSHFIHRITYPFILHINDMYFKVSIIFVIRHQYFHMNLYRVQYFSKTNNISKPSQSQVKVKPFSQFPPLLLIRVDHDEEICTFLLIPGCYMYQEDWFDLEILFVFLTSLQLSKISHFQVIIVSYVCLKS